MGRRRGRKKFCGLLLLAGLALSVSLAGCGKAPVAAAASSAAPAAAPPPDISLPAGTALRVRLNEAIDTSRNRPGDVFGAALAEPVMAEGKTVIPAGAEVRGRVTESMPSGRLKGRAVLSIILSSIELNGLQVDLSTSAFQSVSADHKKRNWVLIGGGSGAGALIGGAAGGGKGAAIGAGAGAAAGTAGAAITGKRHASIPAESLLTFRLRQPLRVPALKGAEQP